MLFAWLLGGAAPYRESVSARLSKFGLTVFEGDAMPDVDPAQTIVVGYCADDGGWSRLEQLDGFLGRTAVIERLELRLYERAIRMRLGVVHIDTRSEAIAAAAIAAGHGETLLPMEIARRIVEVGVEPSTELDPLERELLRSVAKGETMASIAERSHYSDRTLRRRLQSAYLKLGVSDRAGAIRAADRLGVL